MENDLDSARKEYPGFSQRAWHGSAYDFDAFLKRGNAASMLTGHPSRMDKTADSLTPSVIQPLCFL